MAKPSAVRVIVLSELIVSVFIPDPKSLIEAGFSVIPDAVEPTLTLAEKVVLLNDAHVISLVLICNATIEVPKAVENVPGLHTTHS